MEISTRRAQVTHRVGAQIITHSLDFMRASRVPQFELWNLVEAVLFPSSHTFLKSEVFPWLWLLLLMVRNCRLKSFSKDCERGETWFSSQFCLPRSPPNEKFLLVWDSFGDHLTEQVKSLLRRRTLMLGVTPGGLTPLLQPLDRCLNKSFKENLKWKCLTWLISSPFEYKTNTRLQERRNPQPVTCFFVGSKIVRLKFPWRWFRSPSKFVALQKHAMEQKMMPFVLQEEMEGIPEARDDEAQDEIANKFETVSEEED